MYFLRLTDVSYDTFWKSDGPCTIIISMTVWLGQVLHHFLVAVSIVHLACSARATCSSADLRGAAIQTSQSMGLAEFFLTLPGVQEFRIPSWHCG
jgi:hypothetical protein